MFASCVDSLRREIAILKSILATHDRLREIVYDAAGGQRDVGAAAGAPLAGVTANLPPHLAWRIYDHCAAFTRLYAVYERCILDMVAEWLSMLPVLFPAYADLPDAVRIGHRVGVSEILSKLGGDRYGHLSEQSTLSGISDGVRGVVPYSLLTDAFLIDDQNLRRETLGKLLSRAGVPDSWGWISGHGDVQRFLRERRGGQNTAEAELRNFISFRNEAAHGVVDQVVATDEIGNIADFISIVCDVVAQLLTQRVVEAREQIGQVEIIGRVFRQFSGRIVAIEATPGRIRVGESVIVRRDQACFATTIESIEVNHERIDELNTNAGDKIGLCLGRVAKVESEIVRLKDYAGFAYHI